jgi:hypothetical protein
MTWVERVDRASPLKGELEMSAFAAILPRRSLKRESVLGGWELPLRVGSKGGLVGGAGRREAIGSIFWDPSWRSQNGRCLNDARAGLD